MIRAALAALCLAVAILPAHAESVEVAIVFVADVSSSMSHDEVAFVRAAHAAALTSPDVIDAIAETASRRIAVTYIEFGASALVRLDWTIVDGADTARAFADHVMALPPDGVQNSATNIGTGLTVAVAQVVALPWVAERIVVDVVGDGIAMDPVAVKNAREMLLEHGVAINALPLLLAPDNPDLTEYYTVNVRAGPGSFVMPCREIGELPQVLRSKIVLEAF